MGKGGGPNTVMLVVRSLSDLMLIFIPGRVGSLSLCSARLLGSMMCTVQCGSSGFCFRICHGQGFNLLELYMTGQVLCYSHTASSEPSGFGHDVPTDINPLHASRVFDSLEPPQTPSFLTQETPQPHLSAAGVLHKQSQSFPHTDPDSSDTCQCQPD